MPKPGGCWGFMGTLDVVGRRWTPWGNGIDRSDRTRGQAPPRNWTLGFGQTDAAATEGGRGIAERPPSDQDY